MLAVKVDKDGNAELDLSKLLGTVYPVYIEVGAQRFQLTECPMGTVVKGVRV